ncbi:MAG: hypothetical protein Q7S22_01590, partial [Candidatus Micrarchaeota archaeon]|nr:hypothetical protein [Candidatus Micrarchaeota archaeon]
LIPLCTDTVGQCVQEQCSAQVCGAFNYNPQPSFSYSDSKKIFNDIKFNTKIITQSESIESLNVNLLGAACNDMTLDKKAQNLFQNTKGTVINSYRFGVGTSFAEFEQFRYLMPASDFFCGVVESRNQKDRYVNYYTGSPSLDGNAVVNDMKEFNYCPQKTKVPFLGVTVDQITQSSAYKDYPRYVTLDSKGVNQIDTTFYNNFLRILNPGDLTEVDFKGSEFECENALSCASNSCSFDKYKRSLCQKTEAAGGGWAECSCNPISRSCDGVSSFVGTLEGKTTDQLISEYKTNDYSYYHEIPRQVDVTYYSYDPSCGSGEDGIDDSLGITREMDLTQIHYSSDNGGDRTPTESRVSCIKNGEKYDCEYHSSLVPATSCSNGICSTTYSSSGADTPFTCKDKIGDNVNCDSTKTGVYAANILDNEQDLQYKFDPESAISSGTFSADVPIPAEVLTQMFPTDIRFLDVPQKGYLGDMYIGYSLIIPEQFEKTNLVQACNMEKGTDYIVVDVSQLETKKKTGGNSDKQDNDYDSEDTSGASCYLSFQSGGAVVPNNCNAPAPIPEGIGMYQITPAICKPALSSDDNGKVLFSQTYILIKSLGDCQVDKSSGSTQTTPVVKTYGWCESCTYATFAKQEIKYPDDVRTNNEERAEDLNYLQTQYFRQGVQPIIDLTDRNNWLSNDNIRTSLFYNTISGGGFIPDIQQSSAVNTNGSSILLTVRISEADAVISGFEEMVYKRTKSASEQCGKCRISVLLDNGPADSLTGSKRMEKDYFTLANMLQDKSNVFQYVDVISYVFYPSEFTKQNTNLCNGNVGDDDAIASLIYDNVQKASSDITAQTGKPTLITHFYINPATGGTTAGGGSCWRSEVPAGSTTPKYAPTIKVMAKLFAKESGLTAIGLSGIVYSDTGFFKDSSTYQYTPFFCRISSGTRIAADRPFLLYNKVYTVDPSDAMCQECTPVDEAMGLCTKQCANGVECTTPPSNGNPDTKYRCPDNLLPQGTGTNACTPCSENQRRLSCSFFYDTGIMNNFIYRISDLNEKYPDIISSIPYGSQCCFEDSKGYNFSYFKQNKYKNGAIPLIYSPIGNLAQGCGIGGISTEDSQICGADLPIKNYKVSCKIYLPSGECDYQSDCNDDFKCNAQGKCVALTSPECKQDSQCGRADQYCDGGSDSAIGVCRFSSTSSVPVRACTLDSDCRGGLVCDSATNTCKTIQEIDGLKFIIDQNYGCRTQLNCVSGNTGGYICSPDAFVCEALQCTDDSYCPTGTKCDLTTEMCEVKSTLVPGNVFATPTCPTGLVATDKGTCVKTCSNDNNCAAGLICDLGPRLILPGGSSGMPINACQFPA